jgi:hypothetical protein
MRTIVIANYKITPVLTKSQGGTGLLNTARLEKNSFATLYVPSSKALQFFVISAVARIEIDLCRIITIHFLIV